MVEENKNKGLFLGIAAATALIGAALLYHYVSGDEEEEGATGGIMTELEEAGLATVQRAQTGQLDPKYTCQMLNFVTITARKRRHDERTTAINQRRECYKSENWTQYRQIVKEQFMAEDQMCQVVLRETMEVLTDVSEAEFQRTMQ